jgi:hypothetical protein
MERHMPIKELLYLIFLLSALSGVGATLVTVSIAQRKRRRR